MRYWIGAYDGERIRVASSAACIPFPKTMTSIVDAYLDAVSCVVEAVSCGDSFLEAVAMGWYLLENSPASVLIGGNYTQYVFREDMISVIKMYLN